jgi:DNA-binding CsgD family transcriptional regulator
MKNFFDLVQSLLQNDIHLEQEHSVFNDFLIMKNECMYVIDFNENKISYKKGFENVLGYTDDEMSLPLLFDTFHPDDEETVTKVIRESILHTIKDPSHGKNNSLYLKYRRRKKDGTYVTIMSQSHLYDLDTEGNRMKSVTKLTDITFADDFTNVSFSFKAKGIDEAVFEQKIHKAYLNFFTKREYDVINAMCKGGTNHEIADELCISEHTVATHRKNILKKSGCHSVDELSIFCEANGILKLKGIKI